MSEESQSFVAPSQATGARPPPQDARGLGKPDRAKGGGKRVIRSYQHGESLGEAERPVIENYGDDGDDGDGEYGEAPRRAMPATSSAAAAASYAGVNRGIANSAEGRGTALPELIVRMRVINLSLCTLALVTELAALLRKVLFRPSRAVLSAYLAFFATTLCCFELHVPPVARFVRSNLGLLYTSGGRALFFVLMGGLSIGQGGAVEWVLGAVMVLNGCYTLYIPWKYPAYEKAYEELGRENIANMFGPGSGGASSLGGYAWANPEWTHRFASAAASASASASGGRGGEREGLVR